MSKLFYDHLVILEELEMHINTKATSKDEKEELSKVIDGLIQVRVMDVVLTNLPRKHHEEFLEKFTNFPHDERIMDYLEEKVQGIGKEIAKEIKLLEKEIVKH